MLIAVVVSCSDRPVDHDRIETVTIGPPGPVVRDLAIGGGSVWVTGYREIVRIDEHTHEVVQRIAIDGHAEAVSADEDRVWAVIDRERVAAIDTSTGRVVAMIDVPGQVNDVATGPAGVWTVSDRGIYEIDPSRSTATRRRSASPGQEPWSIALGQEQVWVVTNSGDSCSGATRSRIITIDPMSGRVAADTWVDGPVRGVAVGDGAVWVTINEGCDDDPGAVSTVLRFDSALHVTARTPVGRYADTPSVGHGCVWVAYSPRFDADDTLARLDADTGEVTDTVVSNGFTASTAASDDAVWTTNQADDVGQDTVTIVR